MRSECFNWFPISGLRLTKIYQNLGDFTRMQGDCGGILLGSFFGECYSIAFGDGLVTVKPQPDFILTTLLVSQYQ